MRSSFNPFYILLTLIGALFCVSACAYGVLAFLSLRGPAELDLQQSSLLTFLAAHGEKLLLGEIAALALATIAAILSDQRAATAKPRDGASNRSS